MTNGEQLQLELDRRCPGCGSLEHHGCGYHPEMVKPAMAEPERDAYLYGPEKPKPNRRRRA
jgi:hypothetical protein